VLPQLGKDLRAGVGAASAADLVLALENESECNVGSGDEVAAALAEAPGLGVIWDPANAAELRPHEPPRIERFLDRIVHVHAKDVGRDGRWARIGDGIVDHAGLLRTLQATGYSGFISVETHYRTAGSGAAATSDCVTALRSIARDADVALP
jgi:sugar phosphate isomerase/epimerase